MNLSQPLTSLIPSLEGQVLTVLSGAKTEFTGAQVHRVLGKFSDKGVRDALNALAEEGIVIKKSAGAAYLYSLNRDHLLAAPILAIAGARKELLTNMGEEIKSWKIKPHFAAVFGSSVRSDMTKASDIDVFIHRNDISKVEDKEWQQQLLDLSLVVERWTGNYLQIFELNDEEIKKELTTKNGVIHNIIREGVVIYGDKGALTNLER